MANENNVNDDGNTNDIIDPADVKPVVTPPATPPVVPVAKKEDADMIAKLVADRLDSELAPIKGKLDNAFKARDEALAKVAEFEKAAKEANLKRLTEEGKHREVYELQIAEANARNEALEKRNTELSRDVTVKDALKSLPFRNDRASEMAFKEIVDNLVKNEAGQWVHRSGISVKDYCEAFSKDDNQSFLFKPKTNSGGGTPTGNSTTSGGSTSTGKQSIFDLSQAEVLKRASEGTLPSRK